MIVYFKFYDGLPEVGSFKHPKSALLIKKKFAGWHYIKQGCKATCVCVTVYNLAESNLNISMIFGGADAEQTFLTSERMRSQKMKLRPLLLGAKPASERMRHKNAQKLNLLLRIESRQTWQQQLPLTTKSHLKMAIVTAGANHNRIEDVVHIKMNFRSLQPLSVNLV